MPQIKTPFELYKHLPKTNCGDCGISTCLAFAAAIIKEEKQ
ncbi:MAG: dehydrogenase/acetyl-CoA synthase gamma subunit (corrinoid Fe-S protein), partial [Nitrospirae bacterium]|nr:dehydrogenase/acetyl-CoA synthase gamma subunit (corrinoid Fe-S protein) [Nitrospirota bacterium]